MEDKATEATEIKPKQVVWLLDGKLKLCIECENLVNVEKKMLLKKFCTKAEKSEGKLLQPSQLQESARNMKDPRCSQE